MVWHYNSQFPDGIIPCDRVSLLTLDEDGYLTIKAAKGLDEEIIKNTRIRTWREYLWMGGARGKAPPDKGHRDRSTIPQKT